MIDATPNSKVTSFRVPTLKKRSDFLRLRSGRYKHTRHFILQCKQRTDEVKRIDTSRAGYTVTTKAGNSVERSRMKRRLREIVSLVFPKHALPQNDYVLIAKRACLSGNFSTIANDLSIALDHVHANRANGGKAKSDGAQKGSSQSANKTGCSDGRK